MNDRVQWIGEGQKQKFWLFLKWSFVSWLLGNENLNLKSLNDQQSKTKDWECSENV